MEESLIVVCLIILNGVFAMTEIALISARKSKLSTESKKGRKSALLALRLSEDPSRFLSTIQIGITVIGILTGIFSGDKIAVKVADWFVMLGMTNSYAPILAQTLIIVLVTFLTLVFGELLPKRIGMCVSEPVAIFMARPMKILSLAAAPFVWILSKSTSLLFRLFGLKEKESKVTEEEIKSIVKEGADDGEVQPVEHEIVRRVFMLGDLEVDALMTPRNEMVWLDISMGLEEIKDVVTKHLFAVYPVADGSFDNIKGIVSLKSLFLNIDKPDFQFSRIVDEATFFYENMDVYKALEQMKSKHISSALVCDEFGTCIGMITLKDILEGLVGAMPEGSDCKPQIIQRADGNGWLVDGQCLFYDFLKYFGEEDLYENAEYNTVAGLCLHILEKVPSCGECFSWKSYDFEIVDMDGARIDKLLVKRNKKHIV